MQTKTNAISLRELELQLDYGRRQLARYEGDWTAAWLLSPIDAPVWIIRTNATRRVRGEWKGVSRISWEILLADGTRLTDKKNEKIRSACQRAAFLVRQFSVTGITASLSHIAWISDFLTIVRWLYLHDDLYRPASHAFTRVDNAGIQQFMDSFIKGAQAGALQYPEAFLRRIYEVALGGSPSAAVLGNMFAIPFEDCRRIVEWLESNNFYALSNIRGVRFKFLSRNKVAQFIGADADELKTQKTSAFLRQFEPELLKLNRDLLLPANGIHSEYPSHRIPTIKEVFESTTSFGTCTAMLSVWENLFRLRVHLPDSMPPADKIKFAQMRRQITREAKPSNVTPWVPLKVSLAYSAESLRWIALYGDDLVNFYISAVRTFLKKGWFVEGDETSPTYIKTRKLRDDWVAAHVPASLKKLRIKRWTSWLNQRQSDAVFDRFRESPSLNDALQVFVGAALVLIATLKPMRESELLLLKHDCVTFVKNDGYWLGQAIRKRNVGDLIGNIARPIPTIVAKAISQVSRLSKSLSGLAKEPDRHAREALFYLPRFHHMAAFQPTLIQGGGLITCINQFCDYVALPTDKYGRRWYVRIHELRKSFLITFFWCFRYASLDAARWIAGHSNHEHIYNYIRANFPGEELPQLEAEYAATQLWDFEATGDRGETSNVKKLHKAVCRHFDVTAINLVSDKDLGDWLELAFRRGIYEIRPYSIKRSRHERRIEIAFRIVKKSDKIPADAVGENVVH